MNDNKQASLTGEYSGLSAATAAQRLREEGSNDLGLSQRRAMREMVLDVLQEPMFMLLLAAGGIYLLMGDRGEALIHARANRYGLRDCHNIRVGHSAYPCLTLTRFVPVPLDRHGCDVFVSA